MIPKMPRGAIPSPRNELAAAEPYRPGAGSEDAVPSGGFPTPNHELAAAQPYRAPGASPKNFLAWPIGASLGRNEQSGDSSWAEEAFAKACAEPKVHIPAEVVESTARECGSSNFAVFLQTHGFHLDGRAYLDGAFLSVDWTNTGALHSAIAQVGPVKIGIAAAQLMTGAQGRVTPGTSGWGIHGLPAGQPEDRCASLCGYGPLATLVTLFQTHDVTVHSPPGTPAGLCYAMFIWGSLGIVDRQSLVNITGEAWVRTPTTIVKRLHR